MIGLQTLFLQQSVSILFPLLTSTYRLSFKTQIAHWNVEGPLFISLHHLFGDQYSALVEAVDDLAERIRSLGSKPDPRLSVWIQESFISDRDTLITERDYLEDLSEDHAKIIAYIRECLSAMGDHPDEGTKDVLIQRLQYHEKTLWMLRSHLVE